MEKTFSQLCIAVLMAGASTVAVSAEQPVSFNRDIRPLLAKNCFACHGPDEGSRKSELRLDTLAGATADLQGHRAVVPGKPDTSELIRRVESVDSEVVMPPPDSGHELSGGEKKLLRNWIAEGGEYKVHWSFSRPTKGELPPVKQFDWPRHAIDHFVLARLEAEKLTPSAQADRYRLIRRVSLDLTGLPPTPEEADAFVADSSDGAFEKVVDRLLASDAYGEHWARMWLDLARYADTKGYEKDRHRDIWKFRDWVVTALNKDMSYDQFTIEQLAGDLLPEATDEQKLATAFHRNTMTNDEGGTDNEEFRIAAVKDRVDTTMQVWMGLTMGCAKCHSHKYDPISQHDYYSFYAYFNQTEDADRSDDFPVLPLPTSEQTEQITKLEADIKSLQEKQKSTPDDATEATIKTQQKSLTELRNSVTKTPVMRELAEGKRRETRMHQRGNFLDPGDVVQPAVLRLFGSPSEVATASRLEVARWITQEENPLTSRVMVNRVWARLFGIGLVETEEDFGTQGMTPSHPELLDWLAVDFRENGWSIKQLIRTVVLSATYQQSAVVTQEKLAKDPRNILLSRGPRFRLSAETVRDQALAVCGLLTHKVGGPSVMPPQPDGVWKSTYNALKWQDATGEDRYRRGLYTYWKRTSPYPAMTTFDAGSGEVCQIRRVRTNTPLQALVTLNDPAFVEAAGALSGQMSMVAGDLAARIRRGFRLTLTRPPSEEEVVRLVALYESLSSDLPTGSEVANRLLQAARLETGDAALIAVANVLLNLDEALMKP
ncbi:MAG: PSD1 and planctomycete cytochrome C domain-containing protein [Planctomycetota bacterium]|nr:PSD1 and planctomycete cytochrome C domain-containing protein [Planctomycetota bacterium]